jgi:hypothetical protein
VIGAAVVSAPAATAARLVNPCSLLKNAEAAKVLGGQVVDRNATAGNANAMCTWIGPTIGGALGQRRAVTITVFRMTERAFKGSYGAGSILVCGLGAPAFAAQGGRAFLSVYRHGFTIDINVALVTSQLRADKLLAAVALKRL